MKKLIVLIVLISLAFLTACGDNRSELDKAWDKAKGQTSDERIKELGDTMRDNQAKTNGDTYCPSCGKYSEGTVRICPYCGQYIKN